MTKVVILKVGSGSYAQGFPVNMQIGDEGLRPTIEVAGQLPPAPEMPLYYNRWQESYYRVGNHHRLSAAPTQVKNISLTEQCLDTARILRARFNTWLRSDEFRPIHETLLAELGRQDTTRIIVQVDQAELQLLPWHLWDVLDRYPRAEIALSALNYQSPATPATVRSQRVRILAILGDSRGIDVAADRHLLEQLPNAEITFLVEPQRKQLTDHLWEQTWDILFFAGHSSSKDSAGRIFINPTDSLTISELQYAVRTAVDRGLQLAIFNSCDGLGLARDLANLRIPQTIVMREPVPDRVAQEFLKYFLTSFANSDPLYLAIRSARERLQGLEDQFPCATWLPVIFQNPAVNPPSWRSLSSPLETRPTPLPRARWIPAILTSLAIAITVLGVRHIGLLKAWELNTFDLMLQARAAVQPELADDRILVVEVDDATIDAQRERGEDLQGRSLSETTLRHLLDQLQQYKPLAIGLDIYQDYAPSQPVIDRFRTMNNLIGICKVGGFKSDPHGIKPPIGLPPERLSFSDSLRDADGVLRRHLLYMNRQSRSPCQADYALSVQLAFRYLVNQGIEPTFKAGDLQLKQVTFTSLYKTPGGYQRQLDLGGSQVLLNFRAAQVPSISVNQVLEGNVVPENLQGRIVLIGTTHRSSRDKWKTPYQKGNGAPEVPGVFIQAQKVSQILSAVLDGRPLLWMWAGWQETLWILAWASSSLLILRLPGPTYRALGTTAALLALSGGSFCILVFQGGWVPVIPAALALILSVYGSSVLEFRGQPPANP